MVSTARGLISKKENTTANTTAVAHAIKGESAKGKTMRTVKEIALELLDKYEEAQRGIIWEYSGDIDGTTKALEEEVKEYENEINTATEK